MSRARKGGKRLLKPKQRIAAAAWAGLRFGAAATVALATVATAAAAIALYQQRTGHHGWEITMPALIATAIYLGWAICRDQNIKHNRERREERRRHAELARRSEE